MFFDGSWWKWGDRKLQEGEGGMSPILALDWGVEAIAPPPVNFCLQWGLIRGTILVVLSFLIVKFRCTPIFRNRVVSSCDVQLQSTCT